MRHSFVAISGTCLAVLAAASLGSGLPAAADDVHATGDRLGTVNFAVNCSSAAQEAFTRSMALYHSFAWSQAMEAFQAVADADPKCGMAHWGRAMVMLQSLPLARKSDAGEARRYSQCPGGCSRGRPARRSRGSLRRRAGGIRARSRHARPPGAGPLV